MAKGPKSDEIIERNGEVHCRTEGKQVSRRLSTDIEQTIEQPTEQIEWRGGPTY